MEGIIDLNNDLQERIRNIKERYLLNYCGCNCNSNCECNLICNCNVQVQFFDKQLIIKNWFK